MDRSSALAQGRAFLPLPDQTELLFTGPDRYRYLNGQLTNAVSDRMPADRDLPACVLTVKGKLCGLVRLQREPDAIRLNAEPELREDLLARLEKYLIADDVELRDVTGQTQRVHVNAALAPEWIARFRGSRSERLGVEGTDLLCPPDEFPALRRRLTESGFTEVNIEDTEPFRIERGIPRWGAELSADILPMEAGLARVAIDFHKGCYLGQEIISRIRSVGHVNKQVMRLRSRTELRREAKLFLPGTTPDDRPVGWITSAAYSFTLETWVALGYVKSAVTDNRLETREPDGAVTEVEVRGPAGEPQ